MTENQGKTLVYRGSVDDDSILNLAYIHTFCKQDEAFFIQTDIENPSEIDIFKIAKEITETEINNKNPQKTIFGALKEYFQNCDKNRFWMAFSEIEGMLGTGLPKEAHKYESFWHKKDKKKISNAWQSQGFEVFKVDLKLKKVCFNRAQKNVSKLSVPEIFLTDKIPNDAKYELERFFEYIRKKYGI